jgi:hypothetical protein
MPGLSIFNCSIKRQSTAPGPDGELLLLDKLHRPSTDSRAQGAPTHRVPRREHVVYRTVKARL